MKKNITIVFLIFNLFSVFSQQEVEVVKQDQATINTINTLMAEKKADKEHFKAQLDLLKKTQLNTIDSLQAVIKTEKNNFDDTIDLLEKKGDTIKDLNKELSKYEKFKKEKKEIDILINQKTDSITLLTNQKFELNQKISNEKIACEQKILIENEKVRNEMLTKTASIYEDNTYEYLIGFLSKKLIARDKELLLGSKELEQMFTDLNCYFEAKALLEDSYDSVKINDALTKLNKINKQSESLDKLKENLENYELLDKGLNDCLIRIDALDKKESVSGMGEDIEKLKFNKILTILTEHSNYMFSYDLNFVDYPYLTNVLYQVIKLKFPNPDRDISKFIK